MNDINDLRRALAVETADMHVDMPADAVRRRARVVRFRRAAIGATGIVAAVALAVPVAVLASGSETGGQKVDSPLCAKPTNTTGITSFHGPLIETGATITGTTVRYDVLIGLTAGDGGNTVAFVIAFRDQATGVIQPWDTAILARNPNGEISGNYETGPNRQFSSHQLVLSGNSVLDMGVYAREAHRITVASEGHTAEASISFNAPTGWTVFWVLRTAAPLPSDHGLSADRLHSPQDVTLTAYNRAGQVQHTVTGGVGVGMNVNDPRDDRIPDTTPEPTPTCDR